MRKMNLMFIAALAAASMAACGSDDPNPNPNPDPTPGGGTEVTDVRPVKSSLLVDLTTDKAVYKPGEKVRFTASQVVPDTKVRYRQGSQIVGETTASSSWEWAPPATDYT